MDFGQSYKASWRVFRVNRDTWSDGEQLSRVDSVNITRTANGKLLETGSLEISGEFEPDYYRIVMTAEQSGEVQRVDVGTFLFDITGGTEDHGMAHQKADGRSVLYPASTTTLIAGEYAPAGVDGADYAGKLLREAINAPVQVEGSFTLNEHIVHEVGSNVLDAVWSVLEAGNYIMQIDGRGVVHIRARPDEPALILNQDNMKLLTNGVNYTANIGDIPNRYVVLDECNRTIAVNNDPNSEISLIRRGYSVDIVDESPKPVNGESYGAYAERRLREKSVMKDERSYTREFAPDVYVYSLVRASVPGLEGDLRIKSQTLRCDKGISVSEKAEREVQLWQSKTI